MRFRRATPVSEVSQRLNRAVRQCPVPERRAGQAVNHGRPVTKTAGGIADGAAVARVIESTRWEALARRASSRTLGRSSAGRLAERPPRRVFPMPVPAPRRYTLL